MYSVNKLIKELAEKAGLNMHNDPIDGHNINHELEKFAQLVAKQCANICIEMAAKCAGLEGDGALAKDCAYWIKEDFEV